MDEDFKKRLFLMIIDKILFGSIIVVITIYFSTQIESRFRETEHLRQMLQSISNVNSDLIVQQRSGLTKSMGEFFKEVSSYAQHANRSKMKFNYLSELKDSIEISIYQIDALSPEFSDRDGVETFMDKLIACNIFLRTEDENELHTLSIEAKLSDVRNAYKNLLDEMREVSTQLAFTDYQKVKQFSP